MNNSIYPCLIIRGKIAEAADFYIKAFGEAEIIHDSSLVMWLELSGQKFMLLNDGTSLSPNPSISFMVISETAEETEKYWNKLIDGGTALMGLDSYDWSPKYGWVQDKYGVSWQLLTGSRKDTAQKFCPTLMFTGNKAGKAADAVNFYTQLFPQSNIEGILKYSKEDGEDTGLVKHAQFSLNNFTAMAMDSSADHNFTFNEAVSLVVECDTQAEIDNYWDKLTANGGHEVACGWLTDKYGISWQIVPKVLSKMFKDPERAKRVMAVVMQMKKLDIAQIENA